MMAEEPLSGIGLESRIWAIVPVKSLQGSKARLASILTETQRSDLIRAFLSHVLKTLRQVSGLDGVLVISRDKEVLEIARTHGAFKLQEDGALGLNGAVQKATELLLEKGATAALVLPADLPFVQVAEVETMLQAFRTQKAGEEGSPPSAVLCSDGKQDGSNALLISLRPGSESRFNFQYGPGSFGRHIREARRLGMKVQTLSLSSVEFDVDTQEDWREYVQAAGDPFADRHAVSTSGPL